MTAAHDLVHLARDDDAAQRQIGAGHALGERHQVGLDAPMTQGEPAAGAAEAGDHLVGDQQHLVPVADLAQAREIGRRRHDHAAGAHDRLGDDGGDRVGPFLQDRLLHRFGGADARVLVARPAIGIGRRHLQEVGHERPEHLVVGRHSRRAHGRHGDAVIAVDARDHLHLVRLAAQLPVVARDLERRFV
jgi:hypothetical protein